MALAIATARTNRAPTELAQSRSFIDWTTAGHFTADREPVDFSVWSYLRPIYAAVPKDLTDFTCVIRKSAQGGASIFAMLFALWLALRSRAQIAYFLPTERKAFQFSSDRFLKLVRENKPIHDLMGDSGSPHSRRVVDEGAVGARRILQSIIYFSSLSGLLATESSPLDAIIVDEVQSALAADIAKVSERISASTMKAKLFVSTANFVGADIDALYARTDQRTFVTRCRCPEGVVLSDCWDARLGPLCIDKGNGTTPGIPDEYFYLCPRCKTILENPRDGEYVARCPEVRDAMGWHFPQMLSPRQTPRSIYLKWASRTSTSNFYNRVLGLPYNDPDTLPVTETMLKDAQNSALRWGPPSRAEVDGIYMGVDQMGGENYCIVAARVGDRMRLLHLEIIQSDDPFRRTAELMSEYHVRFCGVEALPNFNEAHLFAKAFPGRVFVVSYADHADEILTWGDRPREKVTVRRSDEEIKVSYSASVDQYKMMSWALGRWANGEVETPDARALTQTIRTDQGMKAVALCKDVLWLHLQRVALVTEYLSGKEDERKLRRLVRKVGIDPHYSYAWMLLCVAWVRAYGTAYLLIDTPRPANDLMPLASQRRDRDLADQLRDRLPHLREFEDLQAEEQPFTCADCAHFDPARAFCKARTLATKAALRRCDEYFEQIEEEEKEWT